MQVFANFFNQHMTDIHVIDIFTLFNGEPEFTLPKNLLL